MTEFIVKLFPEHTNGSDVVITASIGMEVVVVVDIEELALFIMDLLGVTLIRFCSAHPAASSSATTSIRATAPYTGFLRLS